jgi:acyl transferase domain-containing protein
LLERYDDDHQNPDGLNSHYNSGNKFSRSHHGVAILSGTAVNQDGRASSLTAPNGPAQQTVIRAALSTASGIQPQKIDVLEMHGTGTALGDPIEVSAAFDVLLGEDGSQNTVGRPLELQAVKSRLLHTEPAAGAVGLAMLVKRLELKGVHHNLHLRTINPHVVSVFTAYGEKKNSKTWAAARQPTAMTHG